MSRIERVDEEGEEGDEGRRDGGEGEGGVVWTTYRLAGMLVSLCVLLVWDLGAAARGQGHAVESGESGLGVSRRARRVRAGRGREGGCALDKGGMEGGCVGRRIGRMRGSC